MSTPCPKNILTPLGSRSLWSQCAQVMRLASPTGWILLALPGFWGFAWACPGGSLTTLLWILAGALWARSLGCFYNDWVDRGLDAQVERTKQRPLVQDPPSPSMFLVMAGIFVVGATIFISFLPLSCVLVALIAGLGTALYPWAKRFTHHPQMLLGLIFNAALWMPPCMEHRPITMGLFLLYAYGVLYTISYDTVYAYQDRVDDSGAGIGSLAVKMGPLWGWWILGGLIPLRFGLLAVLAVYGGSKEGGTEGASPLVFMLLGAMMLYQLVQWWRWDLKNPDQCAHTFKKAPQEGYLLTLWLLLLSIAWV